MITDDAIVQNINEVMLMEGSQDNILTTVDTVTLQSDMTYTIQVSFSNMDGEFNISGSTNFSKWNIIHMHTNTQTPVEYIQRILLSNMYRVMLQTYK